MSQPTADDVRRPQESNSGVSRRELIRWAGIASLGAGALSLLAACGSAATGAPTTVPAPAATTAPTAAAAPTTAPPLAITAAPVVTVAPTAAAAPTAAPAAQPTAAATAAPAAGTSRAANTLIRGRGGDSVKLDPHDAVDGESAQVTTEIYDTLVRFSQKQPPLTIEPSLAEAWEISPDNTQITFHLRKGVKFHDGTDFNADAVVFNFQRLSDDKNQYHKGAFEYWKENFGGYPGNLKAIDKVDDMTVKLTMAKPDGVILPKLALFSFAMVSPTAVKKDLDNFFKNPVGTGPFVFKEWVPGDHITLTKNDNYWEGAPKLSGIIFRVIPDNSARAAEMQAGTIDDGEFALSDVPNLAKNPDISVIKAPAVSTGFLAFNQSIPQLKDVKVRQAFAYAINRQAIVDAFYGGFGQVPTQFQPPAILGYNQDLKYYEYNPDKAKQLLKDAGQATLTLDFWYMSVIRGYFPDPKGIAQAIASDLSKVGVTVNLKTEDWAAYLTDRFKGKFPIWMIGWGSDNGDPDNYLGYHFDNVTTDFNYDNPHLRDILGKAAQTVDPAKRAPLYQEAQKIVNDDVPVIPIAWAATPALERKTVHNFTNPLFTEPYRNVTVG